MLNRRILRIKVMQAFYALKQSEVSNYHGSLDYISDVFAPDLNSMEVQDHKKLNENKALASRLFEESFNNPTFSLADTTTEIKDSVEGAIKTYKQNVQKDKKHYYRLLTEEFEKLEDLYNIIMKFPLELAESGEDVKYPNPFLQNKVVPLIAHTKELTVGQRKFWDNAFIIKTLKKLKEDKDFHLIEGNDFTADQTRVLYLVKNIVLKDEEFRAFFEERDIKWQENKSVIKNMVVKTFKNLTPEDKEIKLMELSPNWEEDKEFFKELYEKTLAMEDELEVIVGEKTKNWDLERIAAIDKVILKLAISEMIHFPSIPVKVTINEYIEISKMYSTPKSKQFINGILDKAALELTEKGVIKKSGRGLIDNR